MSVREVMKGVWFIWWKGGFLVGGWVGEMKGGRDEVVMWSFGEGCGEVEGRMADIVCDGVYGGS